MNWKIGFFRLWLVCAVAMIGVALQQNGQNAFRSLPSAGVDLPLISSDGDLRTAQDREANELKIQQYAAIANAQARRARYEARKQIIWAVGLAAVFLVCGIAVGWVMQGFRKPRPKNGA